MGDNFSDPITIRLAKGHRRKINALAEKNGTTTAGVLRSIVEEYLAGNDLEHRLRIAHEETLNRTMERVVSSVEQGVIFAVEKFAERDAIGAKTQPTTPPGQERKLGVSGLPSREEMLDRKRQEGSGRYNITALMAGVYNAQISEEMKEEMIRRYDHRYPDDCGIPDERQEAEILLELLNDGWKPNPSPPDKW